MTCTNCGKPITVESSVAEEGYLFCNTICRYEWRTKGKPTPFAVAQTRAMRTRVTVSDLDFPIDLPGFENRGMRIRLSYWTAPKVYLDGNLLHPVKKGSLGRVRYYMAVSNFGKEVPIRLRRRLLDQVPALEVDGHPYLIARPLNPWEYVWMSLPVLLLSLGGAIAGLLAGAAVFSNSILMRRIDHWVPRYVLTGTTTVMAFLLAVRLVTTVNPLMRNLMFSAGMVPVDNLLVMDAAEINRRCPIMLDSETRADSVSVGPGKVLTYHYTIVNRSANELNAVRLRENLQPGIVRNVKSDPSMKALRESDVSFVYRYRDKSGAPVFDLTVTPAEYR